MLLTDKEEIEMGLKKKRGRPVTGKAKNIHKSIRMTEETASQLGDILEELDVSLNEYFEMSVREAWENRFIRME